MTIYIYRYSNVNFRNYFNDGYKCGYTSKELLEYIDRHYDSIECELKGEMYKEPKKRDHNFCIECKLRKIVDYERSTLVCTRCGQFEFYPFYVSSYNHTMRYSKRKCIYKRSDNFKVILKQFFYGGKRLVPDDVMGLVRGEIHDGTNILYPYEIPLTIPLLECILKRNELTMYKDSIYFIYSQTKWSTLSTYHNKRIQYDA